MPTFILGADHGGFSLKESVRKLLEQRAIRYEDLSQTLNEEDDYPLVAQRVAHHVAQQNEVFGILVCTSGLGMDIAANRVRGARAAVIRTTEEARLAREHNHANILVLGEAFTTPRQAAAILTTWLDTRPSYARRHVRRVHQMDEV